MATSTIKYKVTGCSLELDRDEIYALHNCLGRYLDNLTTEESDSFYKKEILYASDILQELAKIIKAELSKS